jgi:MFS family permease
MHQCAGFAFIQALLDQGMSRVASTGVESRRAWLTVAAAFLAGFVVFGITYSFGIFVEPMAGEFHASRVVTSKIFSITGLTFYALGSLTGHLTDRLGPRIVVTA